MTGDVFRSGWGRAALAAGVILAIVYALNLLLAWLQGEATPRAIELGGQAIPNPVAAPGIPRAALLSMFTWHAVSFDARVPLPQGELPVGVTLEVSVVVAVMLGLGLVGYLLFRAGQALAETGLGWLAVVRGVQIALIYASLMLALAIVGGFEISIADLAPPGEAAPDTVAIQPSLASSFFMPLLLGMLAAGAGSLSGTRPSDRALRLSIAAISGGWRAAWIAVALASMAFLVVAALHPEATRAYLEVLPGGAPSKILTVLATLLVLPNVGTGIAAAAMGGSIDVGALGSSCAVISFLQFPQGTGDPGTATSCPFPVELGPAPMPYFLFLLVPLAATIVGGHLTSQRVGVASAGAGAVAGLAMALPFALWLWVLALVARVGYSAGTSIFAAEVWIGPGLLSAFVVALVWGAVGGAIGGALGARDSSVPGASPDPPTG